MKVEEAPFQGTEVRLRRSYGAITCTLDAEGRRS